MCGRRAMAHGRPPVWIVLARRCFAAKSPVNEGWKSLDFLGFSRQNRAFSMAYTGISAKSFSWPSVTGAAASSSAGWRLSTMRLTLSSRRCRSFRPIRMFRHDRVLVLVEPIDHLDQRGDRLELPDARSPRRRYARRASGVRAAGERGRRRGRSPAWRELPRRSGEPAPR